MRLVVMNRTEAGVESVLQAEHVQMPMWGDLGLRKVFRSLELTTTATCGAEHQKRQMRHTIAGEDPPDGVRTSSPVICGRCSQRAQGENSYIETQHRNGSWEANPRDS